MGFVEAVTGKLLHQVEDIGGSGLLHPALDRADGKGLALLGHLLGLLLAHGAAQQVGTAQGVTGQHLGDTLHLLLIEDDAIGRFEHRFQIRMRILYLGLAVFAVDKVIHHARLQRAGTKQRHQRDDVFKTVRLQTVDQVLHAARFQLEYGGGLGGLEGDEAGTVIQRDGGDIRALADILALQCQAVTNIVQGPVDNGQGAQPEEVELDQTDRLHIVLVELGNDTLPALFAVKRGKIRQFAGRDHHPPGVFAGITGDPLQLQRHVDQALHLFVVVVAIL